LVLLGGEPAGHFVAGGAFVPSAEMIDFCKKVLGKPNLFCFFHIYKISELFQITKNHLQLLVIVRFFQKKQRFFLTIK